MRDRDLPLFAWSPPCKVIAFPLNKRAGKIRRVADVFSRKSGNDQTSYWLSQISHLSNHLEKVGYSQDRVEAEIDAFREAVEAELLRMSFENRGHGGNNPRGAA